MKRRLTLAIGCLACAMPSIASAASPNAARTTNVATAQTRRLNLPGAAQAAQRELDDRGLAEALRERVERGRPVLGICLGMQLLFEESEEGGRGLGVLRGPVRRLRSERVPHMGWNTLHLTSDSALLEDGADVYFAHSFACAPAEPVAVAEVDHESPIISAVERGAVAGVQFHPERSGAAGTHILRNALAWSRSA